MNPDNKTTKILDTFVLKNSWSKLAPLIKERKIGINNRPQKLHNNHVLESDIPFK